MRKMIILAVLSSLAAIIPAANAQDVSILSCRNLIIPVTGVPDQVPLSFTIPKENLVTQCTASEGNIITLVTPQEDIAVTPEPGSTKSVTFQVRDDEGYTASAELVITRDITATD